MVVQNRNGGSMSHQERRIKAVGSNHCEKLESGGGGVGSKEEWSWFWEISGEKGEEGPKALNSGDVGWVEGSSVGTGSK